MLYLLVLIILLFLSGLVALWLARRIHHRTGLPSGEVIYSDTGAWEKVEKPLVSRRYGLIGKPDYLVRVAEKGRKLPVPVEVKSRKRPERGLESHTLQLAAYCLLVEEHFKQRPPYGLLHYTDATLQIPFTDELRRQVLDAADAIRRARDALDVHRQHNDPSRCFRCGYLRECGEQALYGKGKTREVGERLLSFKEG
jgi:CRISPR-associated exonuclease Cas4